MPGLEGIAVVRGLRERDRRTPVLMVSAVATTADRIEGLRRLRRLSRTAWEYDFAPVGNILGMHIHRLSQKVDHGFDQPLIHTVPGAGYMLREP
jgi:DNA-binding response OmpR family regulator